MHIRRVKIATDGTSRMIYDEALDLSGLGNAKIKRASHVEPDKDGKWWADMAPSGGGKLGPFDKRSEAIAAEIKWLEERL